MTDSQQSKFDGWAIVDVLGHQRYVGYVTTEAYGQAVLFRIDVPALDARERETKRPEYLNGDYIPPGAKVSEGAVDGYTKLVGSGSIYTITPCTKEAALAAVEDMQRRPLMSVTLPPTAKALLPPRDDAYDNDEYDDVEEENEEEDAQA